MALHELPETLGGRNNGPPCAKRFKFSSFLPRNLCCTAPAPPVRNPNDFEPNGQKSGWQREPLWSWSTSSEPFCQRWSNMRQLSCVLQALQMVVEPSLLCHRASPGSTNIAQLRLSADVAIHLTLVATTVQLAPTLECGKTQVRNRIRNCTHLQRHSCPCESERSCQICFLHTRKIDDQSTVRDYSGLARQVGQIRYGTVHTKEAPLLGHQ